MSQVITSIRCSSLPLVSLCAASMVDDGVRLAGGGEAADIGTAAHAFMARAINGEMADTIELATEFGVDHDELSQMCQWGWRAWERVYTRGWIPLLPPPQTEVEVACVDEESGLELTGHIDVLSVQDGPDGPIVRLADFKSGRLDLDASEQLRGYAWLALRRYPDATSVWAAVIRLRDQVLYGVEWTRQDLEAWYRRLVRHVGQTGMFAPGPQCRFCPRGLTCPAKTALIRQSVEALTKFESDVADVELGAAPLSFLPTELAERGTCLADVLECAKLVEGVATRAREMIKADVVAHGGTLPTTDGRELRTVETKRRDIAYAPAWPILRETIPSDTLCECVSVSKTKIEEAVKSMVGRGQKTKAVKEVMDRLEQAGAITIHPILRLEVRRNDPGSNNGTQAGIAG